MLGIVGLCVFIPKKNGSGSKIIAIISAIILAGSLLVSIIPIGFFGFIALVNSVPPDTFVQTDIVIEENGYQDERFTADGVVYEALPIEFTYASDAGYTPVFSYKTSGFLNGALCGNYYLLENDGGFNLVFSDYGTLFCPTDEKAAVTEYYSRDENRHAYYSYFEKKLPAGEQAAIKELLSADFDAAEKTELSIECATKVDIYIGSEDGALCTEHYTFLIHEGQAYFVYNCEFDYDDNGELIFRYLLIGMDAEDSKLILDIYEAYGDGEAN